MIHALDRHEIEMSIVCAASTETESAILLLELREDDFSHGHARIGFRAIRAILDAHEKVDQLLVYRRMVDAGHKGAANAMLETLEKTQADFIPVSTMKLWVGHLVEMSTRGRVQEASRRIEDLTQDPENGLEVLHEKAPLLLAEALSRSVPHAAVCARDILIDLAADAMEQEATGEVKEPILETGLGPVDEHGCGGCIGEVVVLAASASMGKSALAAQITSAWAEHGKVYYWSGEMKAKQLGKRFAGRITYKPKDQLDSRAYSQASAAPFIENIFIDDEPLDADLLVQKLIMYKLLNPDMKAAVIDYLGLLCDNDYKLVSRASRLLKRTALKLGIAILLLVQLKRGIGDRPDKTPKLDDLKDSGQIENDADKVLMLHRPGYYDPKKDQSEAILFVRKFRDGERNTGIRLRWNGPTFSFSPYVRPPRPSPELREPSDEDNEHFFPGWNQIEMEDVPL